MPYSPNNVYNVDETGLTIVQTKVSSVIRLKGKRQIASLRSAERGALITAIFLHECGWKLARENHVTILCLPPHSTYKLQPLDKSFIGPLKVYYSEEIRIWISRNQRSLSPFDGIVW